jgi:hypothetical protein
VAYQPPSKEQIAKNQAEWMAQAKKEMDEFNPPEIKTGNVILYRDLESGDNRIGWVTELDPSPGCPFIDVQVINWNGDPVLDGGMIIEGFIDIEDQFIKVMAHTLADFKGGNTDGK